LSGAVVAALGPLEQASAEYSHAAPPLGSYIRPIRYQQSIALPSVAESEIESLKQAPENSRRFQIGMGRTFQRPIVVNRSTVPVYQWTVLPDGWSIWSADVGSQGALGLRVHIESLRLPNGARLIVYNPAKPEHDPEPVTTQSLRGRIEVWTGTIFADHVIVECQLPPGTDPNSVSFVISGVSHLYALPMETSNLKAGSCHNDVSCYPNYAEQASGVARIAFVERGNTRVCTGCLLAGNDSSQSFFLTANHCVYDQDVASTVEYYWFYQTSSCNGSAPSLGSATRTGGGADLLATSDNNDFSFMRLRQRAPSGATPLSWSTSPPSSSEPLACIHHPTGSYKRISFGNKMGANANFWGVAWNSGVTEPGSSGSPLLNGNHQVIGQLNAGFNGSAGSSCTEPDVPDQFGKFDETYPSIQQWLEGSAPPTPPTFAQGTYTGLFYDQASGPSLSSAGSFTITTTTKGKFSGKFQIGAVKFAVSGQLDSSGTAVLNIPQRHISGQLQIDPNDLDRVTGVLSDGSFNAQLDGDRVVFSVYGNSASQAGQYTAVIPNSSDPGSSPGGDSYGIVTVDRLGHTKLSGALADGTKFSQAATLSKDGRWPLYASLYGGRGFIFGWISFSDNGSADLSGTVVWGRPTLATAKVYPQGFNYEANLYGSRYRRPVPGGRILELTDANVLFHGGGLDDLSDQITIGTNSRVINLSENQLSLSFSSGNGLFRGSVRPPGGRQSIAFNGVVFQKQNTAYGYFLGLGESGYVTIGN